MSSLALITLEISDFFPQNFPFDNFCFIFTSDSHDFESEIYYLSKNQITHKTLLLKKDIKYSIKILRNDSLIGISDFIIPSMLFMRKENFFEKICMINMTDSTKRLLFGNLSPSNNLRINIRAKITYMQGQANKNNKKIFSPKNSSGINSKKNMGEGSPKINNGNNVYNANTNNIGNQNNNINNSNFVFNKQQIPMSKKVPLMKSSQNNNNINNNINIGNRYNKNNNMNMADIILQQQQNTNLNNNQKNILPKNNFFQKNSNREKGQSPIPGQKKIEEDPADTSVIYPEISNPIQPIDEEFTEFMQKFIEKNPLEQLNQFNDINEMMIYTKNVIDKLLCYQQEYYERLKTSVSINNRLNEILMKYNEKYRNIVKKIHRLNEETNSNDMKKDAVINVHRTENSNLKQIIPLKMKELKLYQEMYGEGIKDILLAKKENEKENNDNNTNNNKSNELSEKKKNVLMKLLKNCVNNYGPFDTLFNKENLEKINSNEKQKNILEKIKQEVGDNNKNNNEKNKLEFVISENPDDLDIKLNQYLTSIYSENRLPKINFKKLNENSYQYGSQQVSVIEEDNVIKIKYDEGTLLLDNFIEINAQAEEEKMMQVNQE